MSSIPFFFLIIAALVSLAYAVLPFVLFHRLKKIQRVLEDSFREQQHQSNALLHRSGSQ